MSSSGCGDGRTQKHWKRGEVEVELPKGPVSSTPGCICHKQVTSGSTAPAQRLRRFKMQLCNECIPMFAACKPCDHLPAEAGALA